MSSANRRLSADLYWDKLYKIITAHAYKALWLIRWNFLSIHSTFTMVKLYTSVVQSQLLYCTQLQLWYLDLMKDIFIIELVQHPATKYILNDYTSCYKMWLIKLKLFPLMYLFELHDILFAIKSIKTPTIQFNIINYINFSSPRTRSGANN